VREMFRGFGAVFYKETLHVRRDFATIFFSLIIPLLQMLLLGYESTPTSVRSIPWCSTPMAGRKAASCWTV